MKEKYQVCCNRDISVLYIIVLVLIGIWIVLIRSFNAVKYIESLLLNVKYRKDQSSIIDFTQYNSIQLRMIIFGYLKFKTAFNKTV